MKPRAYPVSRPPRSRVEARTIYAPCAAGRGAVSMSRVPTHGKPTVLHEARPGNFRVGVRISTKARTGELVGALVGFDPPALRGANSISQRYESLVSRKSQFDSEDGRDPHFRYPVLCKILWGDADFDVHAFPQPSRLFHWRLSSTL